MRAGFTFETAFVLQALLSGQFDRVQRAHWQVVEMRARTAEAIAQSRELMARADELLALPNLKPL
jgi:hypothetical protein